MPSTQPSVRISPTAITPLPPSLRNQINTALLSSGAIPNIQSTLSTSLTTSGWTANLNSYILESLRSGEFGLGEKGYEALMEKIVEGVGEGRSEIMDVKGKGKMKFDGERGEEGGRMAVKGKGLEIPKEAVEEGVKVVRTELERVCVVGGEDEDE